MVDFVGTAVLMIRATFSVTVKSEMNPTKGQIAKFCQTPLKHRFLLVSLRVLL